MHPSILFASVKCRSFASWPNHGVAVAASPHGFCVRHTYDGSVPFSEACTAAILSFSPPRRQELVPRRIRQMARCSHRRNAAAARGELQPSLRRVITWRRPWSWWSFISTWTSGRTKGSRCWSIGWIETWQRGALWTTKCHGRWRAPFSCTSRCSWWCCQGSHRSLLRFMTKVRSNFARKCCPFCDKKILERRRNIEIVGKFQCYAVYFSCCVYPPFDLWAAESC